MSRRALLTSLAVILLAGACGSNELSKEQYVEEVAPLLQQATRDLGKFGIAISRAPAPQLAADRATRLRTALEDTADRLEELDAPSDIDAEHERLASALRGLSGEVAEIEDETEKPVAEYSRLESFYDELISSEPARELGETVRALERSGYDVSS